MAQPLSTPFPNPPSYYQAFTPKSLAELREREAQHDATGTESALKSEDLPEHLRLLRPPTPPGEGQVFVVFGEERTVRYLM